MRTFKERKEEGGETMEDTCRRHAYCWAAPEGRKEQDRMEEESEHRYRRPQMTEQCKDKKRN